MQFQDLFPTADQVTALAPEVLGIRMLPVLEGWDGDHAFNLQELLNRVCGDGQVAFPLAYYPSGRAQVASALEEAWRWLERQGLIMPTINGPSSCRLSPRAIDFAKNPDRALLMLRAGGIETLSRPGPTVTALHRKLEAGGMRGVEVELARALASLDSDPEDALTAASSALEAACRSILVDAGVALPVRKDVEGLLRAVQDLLAIRPRGETDEDVRRILGGLTNVVLGVGALRTRAGDAHGREAGGRSVPPRIARLSVNAACATALFLIESWDALKEERRGA